jgi:hypothetical protein
MPGVRDGVVGVSSDGVTGRIAPKETPDAIRRRGGSSRLVSDAERTWFGVSLRAAASGGGGDEMSNDRG